MTPSASLPFSSSLWGLDSISEKGRVCHCCSCSLFLSISGPWDSWGEPCFSSNLRLEPPDSLGLSSVGQVCDCSGALYLPLLWLIEGGVTDIARSTMQSILDMESLKDFQLPNESVWSSRPWGSVSTIVLLALAVHRLSILGKIGQGAGLSARPAGDSYQGLISRWDMLRVPADQGLMLTAFTAAGAVLSILFWSVLPVVDAASA